ncbi:MAG TPA: MFS transporter [Streptosporangiaceae bacterium]|nr:MFS transporter [Streptosporangiaceae bacterium]
MSRQQLTIEPTADGARVRPGRHRLAARWRVGDTAAFYLLASLSVSFLAGSAAPTPLYARYQQEWGFSPITTTVIWGVYALAVLTALLVAGSLSDHLGRRPILLASIAVQAATMVVFATAGGVSTLVAARIIQGLATGAAVGAIGAGLVDLHRSRGTVANAVVPPVGTAVGAIGAGLLVQYLPDPAELVYLVLLGVFALQWAGVALMPEPGTRRPGAAAALRPRISVPPSVRRPVLATIPALLAVWSLGGFYGSLGPALVSALAGAQSAVLGGLALFVLAAVGALTVLALRRSAPRRMLVLGMAALLAGVGLTLVSVSTSSVAVFLIGTSIAGIGFGGGFQGAIQLVLPQAAAHERAGVLSAMWVVSYLALGLPAVIAGYLVVDGGGLLATTREFGAAVMALAVVTIVALARPGGPRQLAAAAQPGRRGERASGLASCPAGTADR